MGSTETFLQLSREFGGELFGPFDAPEIRLGSGEGNDIRLAEGLGVAPRHVRLVRRGDEDWILAPVERSAAVWLLRSGAPEPTLVQSPTGFHPGDTFALVTPEGVSFQLVRREPPPKRKRGQGGSGLSDMAQGKGRGIIGEVWRRVRASVVTTGLGSKINNLYYFVRSGQLFSPLYMVGALTLFSGWFTGCGTAAWGCKMKQELAVNEASLQQCEDYTSELQAIDDDDSYGLELLTARILDDPTWRTSLDDPGVRAAYVEELGQLFELNADAWRPEAVAAQGTLARFDRVLGARSVPMPLRRITRWLAFDPRRVRSSRNSGPQWRVRPDATATATCHRGPLPLTYRQGHNLGLTVEPSLYIASEDWQDLRHRKADVVELMRKDAARAGIADMDLSSRVGDVKGAEAANQAVCASLTGEDQRDELSAVAGALDRRIGARARSLPVEDKDHWLVARLVLWYAQDLPYDMPGRIDLSDGRVRRALESPDGASPDQAAWVTEQTGRLLARAVALPCVLALDLDPADEPPEHVGPLPDPLQCIVLAGKLRYRKL